MLPSNRGRFSSHGLEVALALLIGVAASFGTPCAAASTCGQHVASPRVDFDTLDILTVLRPESRPANDTAPKQPTAPCAGLSCSRLPQAPALPVHAATDSTRIDRGLAAEPPCLRHGTCGTVVRVSGPPVRAIHRPASIDRPPL